MEVFQRSEYCIKKNGIIDSQVMSEMLCKAYSNLSDLTDAKPGDKH